MLNVVAIMGRLVADPELRTTPQGINVCSFRIACDRNFARQGEQRQADFIDIVAWRSQAEFVSKYFQKGSLIAIDGSIQTRQYQDKNGNNRTAFEIVANNINFAGPKNSNAGGGANYQNYDLGIRRRGCPPQGCTQSSPFCQIPFPLQTDTTLQTVPGSHRGSLP